MAIGKSLSVCAAIAAGVAFSATAATATTHCVRVITSATAITKDAATALAREGLYQSNMWAGRKARGAVTVHCNYVGVVTTCKASQVGCK